MARLAIPGSGQIFLAVLVAIVVLQILGAVAGNALGFEFNAGPFVVLLFFGLSAWVAIGLVRNYWFFNQVDRGGLVLFVIVFALVFVVSIFLPDYLPEIFEEGARTVQAAVAP